MSAELLLSKKLDRRRLAQLGLLATAAAFTPRLAFAQTERADETIVADGITLKYDEPQRANQKQYQFMPQADHIRDLILTLADQKGGSALQNKCSVYLASNPIRVIVSGKHQVKFRTLAFFERPHQLHNPSPFPLVAFPEAVITDVITNNRQDQSTAFAMPHELRHLVDYIAEPSAPDVPYSKMTPIDHLLITTALSLSAGTATWLWTRNRQQTTTNAMRAMMVGVAGLIADGCDLITPSHTGEYEYSLATVSKKPLLTDLAFKTFRSRS